VFRARHTCVPPMMALQWGIDGSGDYQERTKLSHLRTLRAGVGSDNFICSPCHGKCNISCLGFPQVSIHAGHLHCNSLPSSCRSVSFCRLNALGFYILSRMTFAAYRSCRRQNDCFSTLHGYVGWCLGPAKFHLASFSCNYNVSS
jgi:hypothetical protein